MSKQREALKIALKVLNTKQDFNYPEFHALQYQAFNMVYEALAEPEQEPVLQDIEQYRIQMAGICTAAIGYWKEADSIHPDYDTLALRDVAKLYAKYDALCKTQPVHHAVIAGALFDFMGWLTSRKERLVLSSADEASPAVDAIRDFAKMRGLSLDEANVQDWQDMAKATPLYTAPPARKPLTDEEIDNLELPPNGCTMRELVRVVERAHGIGSD